MRYHCVCFDVGMTLINERSNPHTLISDVLHASGHTVSPQALAEGMRAAQRWYNQRYHALHNEDWSSDASIRAMWMRYYEELFTVLDPAIDHALLAAELISHYESPRAWHPYADVLPTLAALHERQVRIGVVSDWSSKLRPILHATGLSRWIDFVVGSADAGYAKPMSELYSIALERAQCPAEQVIHVGDSYRADVLGARSVGMAAALLDRHQQLARADCPILHDLRQLIALVDGLD